MRIILSLALLSTFAASTAAQLGGQPKETPPLMEADPNAAAAPAGGASNAIFEAIDVDSDGAISKTELKKAIVALKKMDTDKDGSITLAEAGVSRAATNGVAQGAAADPAQAAIEQQFRQFDRDGNGMLTANELGPNAQQALAVADKNGDRAIDRTEVSAMMANLNGQFQQNPGAGGLQGGPNAGGDQAGQVMTRFDQNQDGKLSSSELPPQMRRAVQKADDLDGDGFMSPGELNAVMARMGGAARAWSAGKPPGQANTFRDPNRRNAGKN